MPRVQTNAVRGEKDVRIATGGGAKKGFTVALCARASGDKLPAYLVFKEKGGKIPPKVMANLVIPRNIKVTATKNGWMTRLEVCISPSESSLKNSFELCLFFLQHFLFLGCGLDKKGVG